MSVANVIQFSDMSEKKSPQKENGYTPIANELLEQFLMFDFTKRQMLVVMAVARMTYGYNRKSDALSGWQISEMTNIDRSDVSKTVNELVALNVLIKHETGRQSHGVFVNDLSINKHYTEWLTVGDLPTVTVGKTPPLVNHPTVGKTPTVTVGNLPTQPLVKHPTHKAIKTNKTSNRKKIEITLKDYLEKCKVEDIKPIPENDSVFEIAEQSKIPLEFLRLGWLGFKEEFFEKEEKKQKCWVQTFRNYVRNGYLKVWAFDRDGNCYLTTKGVALKNRYGNEA